MQASDFWSVHSYSRGKQHFVRVVRADRDVEVRVASEAQRLAMAKMLQEMAAMANDGRHTIENARRLVVPLAKMLGGGE